MGKGTRWKGRAGDHKGPPSPSPPPSPLLTNEHVSKKPTHECAAPAHTRGGLEANQDVGQGLQGEHALQGDSCPVDCFFIYDYLVDDLAFDERFKHPGEVGGVDAVHS
jgi:hypothetical protein